MDSGVRTLILSYIVSTGDVSDKTIGFGLCALFGVAGIIFLIMALLACKEYIDEKKRR
ncbi:MAG: hypothetical protein J6Y08_09835 [Clostridiales bacterium]|nr:hypothetical protein [Clostridiales bacterium]